MALLEVNNLSVEFPIRKGILNRVTGAVRAVSNVSFALENGQTLGLVGESGCGKTTLGRAILGLEKNSGGVVFFNGQNMTEMSEADRRLIRSGCQMIFQDPYASLNPRMTVMELVTEGMVYHKMLQDEPVEDAAKRLLADVGMGPDALFRYPHEFSGGQRQRISIARALAMKPRLIVCDEPVSALDVSVQAQVINLLMDLREKYGLAYIFISHDLNVVRIISEKIAVMYLGRIVEIGDAQDVMNHPQHPYTQALLSAVPVPGRTAPRRIALKGEMPSPANPPPGCPFHPRCPMASAQCADSIPELMKIPGNAEHLCRCQLNSRAR